MQQIKKRPAVAERFVLWPLGLEADGPSPIVRGGFQTDTRAGILKISKFYFFREPLLFRGQFPHRGGYVLLFLACDTIPRFLSFCMDIWGGGENLFLCSLGEWTYSYPAALPMSPALPFIGGTPSPCCLLSSPGRPPQKKIPPRVLLHLQPVPGFRLLVPPSFAPFPPAAALPLATISLNTYLANNEITYYRSFAAASGCSASILYPHRSPLRL